MSAVSVSICAARVGLIEVLRSKRVEKQIADIQEKSDKKRMEVSERMWVEIGGFLMVCGRLFGSNLRASNKCRQVDRRRLWREVKYQEQHGYGVQVALQSVMDLWTMRPIVLCYGIYWHLKEELKPS